MSANETTELGVVASAYTEPMPAATSYNGEGGHTTVHSPILRLPASRKNLGPRSAELLIFLLAVLGAVALGLGIADYLGGHPYVSAYLVAYAAFRFADLVVRDDRALRMDNARFRQRIMSELPILLVFVAAPLERTYLYGGEGPRWLAGLGLLVELAGLWLALGARIQLGFFTSAPSSEAMPLVRNGLYRYIRHPIYAGEFLVLLAWPFEYAAPITLIVTLIVGVIVVNHRAKEEEAEMLARFGDDYAAYMRETDSIVPNLW
ncbi:MAG: methyltransferase family protein [Candidatus Binataceae bacterium]